MNIVVADKVDSSMIEFFQNEGFIVKDVSENKDELDNFLETATALVVRSATQVDKSLLDKAKNLRVIGRPGVGLDNVDLEECKKRNIAVYNSPEAPTKSVAEFTLGLLISVARKVGFAHINTREGIWVKKESKGIELFGKTLGIVGTGAIGSTLARYAIALGMNVVGYDIVINKELESLPNFKYMSFEGLLMVSDMISLHVPLLESTKHMINESSIGQMKDGVIIINASRGGVIDENALLLALESGKVFGAALDVFEVEPVIRSKLTLHENIIVTPHIGANTTEALRKNSSIVASKVATFLHGESS